MEPQSPPAPPTPPNYEPAPITPVSAPPAAPITPTVIAPTVAPAPASDVAVVPPVAVDASPAAGSDVVANSAQIVSPVVAATPSAPPQVIGTVPQPVLQDLSGEKPTAGHFGASTTTIHTVRWALFGLLCAVFLLAVFILVRSGQFSEWWTRWIVEPIKRMSQP